jgi:hypothetical protein
LSTTTSHACAGAAARFMVRSGQVLEIQKVTERYRCWFKDNYVHKGGSQHFANDVVLCSLFDLCLCRWQSLHCHGGGPALPAPASFGEEPKAGTARTLVPNLHYDAVVLTMPLCAHLRVSQTSESAGYFCEKDQILTEDFEAYPGYAHFLEWPTLPLGLVCDTKGAEQLRLTLGMIARPLTTPAVPSGGAVVEQMRGVGASTTDWTTARW